MIALREYIALDHRMHQWEGEDDAFLEIQGVPVAQLGRWRFVPDIKTLRHDCRGDGIFRAGHAGPAPYECARCGAKLPPHLEFVLEVKKWEWEATQYGA